jgi:hypothetical protein
MRLSTSPTLLTKDKDMLGYFPLSIERTIQPILKRTSGYEISTFPKGLNEVTAEIQRLPHISEGEMEMVDYYPLRSSNHKQPAATPELDDEEQAALEPIFVDCVYNHHEDRNGKTIALTVSFQLPLLQGGGALQSLSTPSCNPRTKNQRR